MNPCTCPRTSRFAPARLLATALLVATGATQAGTLVATVSQNPGILLSDTQPGSSAAMYYPDALNPVIWATATRTTLTGSSDGTGALQTELRGASAQASTNYTLWDPSISAALDGGVAAGLVLSFNFVATLDLTIANTALSTSAGSYNVTLFNVGFDSAGDGVTTVCGPTSGCLSSGNAGLMGSHVVGFSVLHHNNGTGLMTSGVATQASETGDAMVSLNLASITLASGTAPAGGLAVKLETGELIPVTPVPEPATWLLWLAAGSWALGRQYTRRAASEAA